jgi:hypothetical protein
MDADGLPLVGPGVDYTKVYKFVHVTCNFICLIIRVWRFQSKGAIRNRISKNRQHNAWPKEKVQKNKQRSTKHTYKTKDRVTRIPLKTWWGWGCELGCSGRVISSCSTSGTHRVNLVTNPVISREWEKDLEVFTTSGTYPWSFVTHIP